MNFLLDAVVKLNIFSKPNLKTSSVLDKAVVGTKTKLILFYSEYDQK